MTTTGDILASAEVHAINQNGVVDSVSDSHDVEASAGSHPADKDNRVLLMEKQAIMLSIQGSVDEFVRHMRDITLDHLREDFNTR